MTKHRNPKTTTNKLTSRKLPMTEESESTGQEATPKTYTEEQVKAMLEAAQRRQLEADEIRIHGNAFFAEALDHVAQLSRTDPFWKRTYQYGVLFKEQFEANTGQAPKPQAAQPAQPKQDKNPDQRQD